MKSTPLTRAIVVGLTVTAIGAFLQWWGVGLPLMLATLVVSACMAWFVPFVFMAWIEGLTAVVRARFWAREQGHFHAFGGVPLRIEDDGLHVWVDAQGLQRLLGLKERDDVTASRMPGMWRRDAADHSLLLRVDAVVQYLGTMPERHAPRVQRLRRYLERQILFPAGERLRRRGGGAAR